MAPPVIEITPEGAEREDAPNVGLFFRGAGALRFSDRGAREVPGAAQTVAAADRFGVALFSDLERVFAAPAAELLKHASAEDPAK